jgi:hypothetical protein
MKRDRLRRRRRRGLGANVIMNLKEGKKERRVNCIYVTNNRGMLEG